jgi:hypothetical protein
MRSRLSILTLPLISLALVFANQCSIGDTVATAPIVS